MLETMCTKPIVVTYSERLNKDSRSDIKVYGHKHSVLCQCGKCDECLKQFQNDWMTRVYSELKLQYKAVFFTLTYRDDTVPCAGYDEENHRQVYSVCKSHVTSWLKQIREYQRKHGANVGFRWFLCSEYGPSTLRPHYHGIVLGLSEREMLPYLSKWKSQFGFFVCREFNILDQKTALNSIRYVAKYCSKGDFENPYVSMGLVEPTFRLMSKSLGKNFMSDAKKRYFLALDFVGKRDCCGKYTRAYLEEISKRLNFSIPPCTYHLARYYRQMVFSQRKDLQIAYSDYVCDCLLEKCSPQLVRIYTEKPYRSIDEADREIICAESDKNIRDIAQRAQDSRKSISKFYKQSKI